MLVNPDRSAIVRAAPSVAMASILGHPFNVPKLTGRSEMATVPIPDNAKGLRVGLPPELHGMDKAGGSPFAVSSNNGAPQLLIQKSTRWVAPAASCRHPVDSIGARADYRHAAIWPRVYDAMPHQ
jgi:hypothetical protein